MPTDQARLWQILLDLQPTIDYLIDLETRVETLEGGGGGGGVTFDWAQVMELTESPWDPDAGGFYANASNAPADGGWLSLKFSANAADLTVGMLGGDDYIESSITDSSHQSAIDVFSSSGGSSAEWDMRVDSGAGQVIETIRSGNRTAIHREAGSGTVKETLTAAVGQAAPLLDLKDENGHDIFMVAPDGSPYATAVTVRGTRADGATKAEFLFFADTDELGTYRESIFKASLSTLAYVTFDAYQDDNTPANSYTTATLRAQVGQTAPLLDLKDENGDDIFTVGQALDNVWRVDGDGAGTPIVADGGGPVSVYVRLDAVDVALGDDQAALQAAFDAALGLDVVVISGDWSLFTMTFAVPFIVNVVGSFDLGGNPATPVLTELDPGRANAAEVVGALTVSPNTGEIGEAGLNITKYDGSGVISHLDDDGGFVFGTITGSENGTLVAKYIGAGVGDPILLARLSDDWLMFSVVSPGSGLATIITSHEATDVPLTITGWNAQTADLLQIRDGDTDDVLFAVGPDGTLTGPGAISKATVHLTGAEIATLFSSPTDIVPAPGSGKALVVVQAFGEFHPDAGVWNASTAGLYWSGGVPSVARLAASAFGSALYGDAVALVDLTQVAATSPLAVALANATNRALRIGTQTADPVPISTIVTHSINSPGSGYAPGDTGTIDNPVYTGAGVATYVVDTVDGGGGVLTATITNHGAGYEQGQGYPTNVVTGGGDTALGFDVLTVGDPGGDLYVTVHYYVIDLH